MIAYVSVEINVEADEASSIQVAETEKRQETIAACRCRPCNYVMILLSSIASNLRNDS